MIVSINDLSISNRLKRVLICAGIITLEELLKHTEQEVRAIKGLGQKLRLELFEYLDTNKLWLSPEKIGTFNIEAQVAGLRDYYGGEKVRVFQSQYIQEVENKYIECKKELEKCRCEIAKYKRYATEILKADI